MKSQNSNNKVGKKLTAKSNKKPTGTDKMGKEDLPSDRAQQKLTTDLLSIFRRNIK